jgi:hypothetical protein
MRKSGKSRNTFVPYAFRVGQRGFGARRRADTKVRPHYARVKSENEQPPNHYMRYAFYH